MTAQEFKRTFLEELEKSLNEIEDKEFREQMSLELGEFVLFSSNSLDKSNLSENDKTFLAKIGFPKSAAPFLSFEDIYAKYLAIEISEYSDYFLIGYDGCGNMLGIEEITGNIYHLDHEVTKKIFINSSLNKFAECLCIYSKSFKNNSLKDSFSEMSKIDPAILNGETFWQFETGNFG